MKEIHPQKRRLNAIQTIKRVVLNTIHKTQNLIGTSRSGSGTSWFTKSGEGEGDFGVTGGNYIDVTESNEIFTVNLDLETAGTPGVNKILAYKAADDYQWENISTIGYWSRASGEVYLTNAGDDLKINDGELIKLEADAAADIKYYSYVTSDTFGRIQIETGGKISWGGGSAATDIHLERNAAKELTISGHLNIVGNDISKQPINAISAFLTIYGETTGSLATAIWGKHNHATSAGTGVKGTTASSNNDAHGGSFDSLYVSKWIDLFTTPMAAPVTAPAANRLRAYCDPTVLRPYCKNSSSDEFDLAVAHRQVWQMVDSIQGDTTDNINFCYEDNYSAGQAFQGISTNFSATPSSTTPVITNHFANIAFRVSTPDGVSFSTDSEFILGNPFRKVGKAITAKFRMKLDAPLTNSEALDSVYIFIQENGSSSNAVYSDITSLGTPLDTTWREFTVSTTSAGSWGNFCRWGIQIRCGNGTPLSGPYDEDIFVDVELVEITQWAA